MALQLYKIASVEVGSATAATIDFSSIPQGYTDLMLVTSLRSVGTSTQAAFIRFNGSTTGYTERDLHGSGSTVSSGTDTNIYLGYITPSSYTANSFSNGVANIPNYAGSNYKSVSTDSVTENNATAASTDLWCGLWSNIAAITSISLVPNGTNNFAQYSTATLYGIL